MENRYDSKNVSVIHHHLTTRSLVITVMWKIPLHHVYQVSSYTAAFVELPSTMSSNTRIMTTPYPGYKSTRRTPRILDRVAYRYSLHCPLSYTINLLLDRKFLSENGDCHTLTFLWDYIWDWFSPKFLYWGYGIPHSKFYYPYVCTTCMYVSRYTIHTCTTFEMWGGYTKWPIQVRENGECQLLYNDGVILPHFVCVKNSLLSVIYMTKFCICFLSLICLFIVLYTVYLVYICEREKKGD